MEGKEKDTGSETESWKNWGIGVIKEGSVGYGKALGLILH